jgi:hypothetical protein
MRAPRFLFFLLAIGAGVALGLVYGWMINPPPYANLKPDTLRSDYKADYILMTAEVYRKDGNMGQAVRRLAILEDKPPDVLVSQALLTARDLKYAPADIETLAFLAQALQVPGAAATAGETGTPALTLTPSPTASPSAESTP